MKMCGTMGIFNEVGKTGKLQEAAQLKTEGKQTKNDASLLLPTRYYYDAKKEETDALRRPRGDSRGDAGGNPESVP